MSPRSSFSTLSVPAFNIQLETDKMERPTQRIPSQSVPTTNQNSPTNHTTQQIPLLNLAGAQQHALKKSKSMPGTSRELPAPTKFTFSSHDVSTMSKMTDNTSQIPHWREFPKPPIRILCRVELKAKLKLDTYKSTCHASEYSTHKSSYPTKPNMIFEPSPEQQYIQQYYEQQGYDSQDESGSEYETSEEELDEELDDEGYGYTYQAPAQQQPSSKHFTFPMQQHQQVVVPQQQQHQAYVPRPYDYQKPALVRMTPQQQQQVYQQQQVRAIQNMEEKKRMMHRSSTKSVSLKPSPQQQQPPSNQVVFTIHPQQHKYSQPDQKRASFSQPSQQQPPQHQRSASHHQLEIRRNRSAPSIQSQTPPKHLIRKPTPSYYDTMEQQPQQPQPPTNAYDLARNLWRKQRRSYQDMLSTLHHKLHMNGTSYGPPQFVSP